MEHNKVDNVLIKQVSFVYTVWMVAKECGTQYSNARDAFLQSISEYNRNQTCTCLIYHYGSKLPFIAFNVKEETLIADIPCQSEFLHKSII